MGMKPWFSVAICFMIFWNDAISNHFILKAIASINGLEQ